MNIIKMEKLLNNLIPSQILCFVIVLILGLFFGTQAQSQIINVPAGDTAALIQAINDANAAPDAATINLGGGVYTLTAINNNKNGDNGLPSIVEDMTINGNGSILERSNNPGTPLFRIIHIGTNGGVADPDVTLNNLTISNGFVTSIGGSLINVGDGIVNINDCLIVGNNADNEQSAGVNNDSQGTMNVLRTTITGNVNTGWRWRDYKRF